MTPTTEATPENHRSSNVAGIPLKAAIYTRVSTADQNAELQRRELNEFACRQGWHVVKVYEDVMGGVKASRPALNRLVGDARARKFDRVLVWKLDRFGRSLVDCLNNIRELEENAIRFIAVTQSLDTDAKSPASMLLLHLLGAAADYAEHVIMQSPSDEGAVGLDFA